METATHKLKWSLLTRKHYLTFPLCCGLTMYTPCVLVLASLIGAYAFVKWTWNFTYVLQIYSSPGSHIAVTVVEMGFYSFDERCTWQGMGKIICGWSENTKTVGIKMGFLLYDTGFVSFLMCKETMSLKYPEKYLV